MKTWGALFAVGLMLAGCASMGPRGGACPAGQERLRTAQLYFGAADQPRVPDAQFRKFVDEELTTRFPDGLTVLEGGERWKGEENRRIREAAKVVLIVLPKEGDSQPRLDAVRTAFHTRFNQDSALRVTPPACVSY